MSEMGYFWSLLILILGITVNNCLCEDGKDCTNYLFYSYVNKTNGNIIINASNTQINPVEVPNWTTQAFYNASINLTGWDILEVRSNPSISDDLQAYHAGYIEGYITRDQIWNYYWNNIQFLDSSKTNNSKIIADYMDKNNKYIESMLAKNLSNDPFWYQASLVYLQLHGILDGYNNATKAQNIQNQTITYRDILYINFLEGTEDILGGYLAHQNKSSHTNSSIKHHGKFNSGSHCSALIKLLPGNSDVYIAHDTWASYSMMNRIIKRYKLAFKMSKNSSELIPGMNTAFSSYPGCIGSVDDFYIMGSGIVALETTINVYNTSLYKDVTPVGEVVEIVRNVIANRLAVDGNTWMNYFKMNNSGTYNNQWMIVNLNKFKPGFDPEEGFLTVLEQAPGKIKGEDQTNHLLQHEYWASYNIPFYPEIYEITGNAEVAKNDSWYSYTDCPRAKMFKRDQSKVIDLLSMIKIMRYNNYQSDSYSICENCTTKPNPCNAISSRCDLTPVIGNYSAGRSHALFGATDAKIVSFTMFSQGEFLAIGGPTTSEQIPPFDWSKLQGNDTKVRHLGQPIRWKFDPIVTNWVLPYSVHGSSDACVTPPNDTDHKKKGKGGVSATEPLSISIYILIATWLVLKS